MGQGVSGLTTGVALKWRPILLRSRWMEANSNLVILMLTQIT